MHVLVTGGTGFVGRALILRLLGQGHDVSCWVRSPRRARDMLGAETQLVDAGAGPGQAARLVAAVERADAVINLAGAPVAGGRWSASRRRAIDASRAGVTHQLVDAIAAAGRRPGVLIAASAVGYYGDRGDEPLDEDSARGQGFLSDVCVAWESAAARAESLGVRVMRARLGVVLGLGGGFLGRLLPAFRAGLGAQLGDGRQFVPWVHLDDVVSILTSALTDGRFVGAVNVVSGTPVRAREVVDRLAQALGNRARLAVPGWLLRLALGEAADVVLASQRVDGTRLRTLGISPAFVDLGAALADLAEQLSAIDIQRIGLDTPAPLGARSAVAADAGAGVSDYLARRPPTYLLRSRITLDAPIDDVFRFFSRPQNLGLLTPGAMSFRILEASDQMGAGGTIDYALRVAGVPLRWRTVIAHWEAPTCFVDAQQRGPYRSWWHQHHFTAQGACTVMEDRVYYAPPFGAIGRAAQRLFIAPQLREVFGYRTQAIRHRFRSPA